jgi:two-component system response regulator BaeR
MNADARHVLVVEDDAKIAQILLDYLRHEGFEASAVNDGQAALRQLRTAPPAIVLLDVMLPGLDGIELCRAIRRFCDVPIIMITARVDELDRLLGLEVGADDYVCKPFNPREVVARVRAQLRRAEGQLVAGRCAWKIEEERLRISWRGTWLPLTPVEYKILRLLTSRPGRVFSRTQLLDEVQTEARDVSDRAIDSHVKNLRRKIHSVDEGADCIASVYGVGYRFDPPE